MAKDVAELPSIPPSAINLNIKILKGVSHCLRCVSLPSVLHCLLGSFFFCLYYIACLARFSSVCIALLAWLVFLLSVLQCLLALCFSSFYIAALVCLIFYCLYYGACFSCVSILFFFVFLSICLLSVSLSLSWCSNSFLQNYAHTHTKNCVLRVGIQNSWKTDHILDCKVWRIKSLCI